MRIIFKAAWRLPRGSTIELDSTPVTLYSDCNKSFTLAIEPVDDFFKEIDRGWALWHLNGRKFSNQINIPWDEFNSALNEEILLQQQLRREKIEVKNDPYIVKISGMAYTILIFEAEINFEAEEKWARHDFFGQGNIVLDAPKLNYFHELFDDEINRMKLAIGLESPAMEYFETICEGSYSFSDENTVIYHIPVNMSAKGVFIPRPHDDKNLAAIKERFSLIPRNPKFDKIIRLISHGLSSDIDLTSSFISIWNAFELLITEFNSQHKDEVLSEKIPLQEFYNKKIRDNIRNNKTIGVADRFFRMAAALDDSALVAHASNEFDNFFRIKKIRDGISHGSTSNVDQTSLQELQEIFQKYVLRWINYQTRI
jgi:hypothetical protein